MSASPALEADRVSYRAGRALLVDDATLRVDSGEVVALAGPNGAGKSTLLALLAGDLRPSAGAVRVGGASPRARSARELARLRAVLPQATRLPFSFTVRQVVSMGRSPHLGPLGRLGARDREVVAAQMQRVEVLELADRSFPTLSGGEAARASLARVLAQETPVVLLDEPTAALDLRHQEVVMRTARELAGGGAAVVMVLHDLNLAAAHADRVGLMSRGRLVACAPPWRALTAERVREVFEQPVRVARHPSRDCPLIVADHVGAAAPHP